MRTGIYDPGIMCSIDKTISFCWISKFLEANNCLGVGISSEKGVSKLAWAVNLFKVPTTFPSSLLSELISHNHLPFFKIFSNFVHFCPNFHIFFPFLLFFNFFFFSPFFVLFSEKSHVCLYFLEQAQVLPTSSQAGTPEKLCRNPFIRFYQLRISIPRAHSLLGCPRHLGCYFL